MNKFKKATKRIIAVSASALMVSGTVFGATSYPTNFVSDDKFDGKVVVGANAKSMDSAAAQSVIEDLKAEFSGESSKVTITYKSKSEGGESVEVGDSKDRLNFDEGFVDATDEFDDGDFSSLLESGTVNDDDGEDEEYDYDQEIVLTADSYINFGRERDMEDETDNPETYVDLDGELYRLLVDFGNDKLNIADDNTDEDDSGLVDSESIEMFGKTFTFDPNNKHDDDITLFASSNIVTVEQGDEISVDSEGNNYNVKVTGANSDDRTAILSVDGVTKQVESGDSTKIAGLDVYVDEVFVSNVGGDSAAVKLFLGSDELVLDKDGFGTDADWEEVQLDGEDLDGYEFKATGPVDAVEEMFFRFAPKDLDEEVEYLRVGDSIADPLFETFSVNYEGPSEDLDAGDKVEFNTNGDELELTFNNRDGEEISIIPYMVVEDGSEYDVVVHEDFYFNTTGNYGGVSEDKFVILEEETGTDDAITKIYEVTKVDYDEDEVSEVKFSNVATGDKFTVEEGDEIGDTETYVNNVLESDKFDITNDEEGDTLTTVIRKVYTQNDITIDLDQGINETDDDGEEDTIDITLSEFADNIDDEGDAVTEEEITFTVGHDDGDVKLNNLDLTDDRGKIANDEDKDFEYALTQFGSYVILDREDGEFLEMFSPEEELYYKVNFVAGDVAETRTTKVNADSVEDTKAQLEEDGYEIVDVSEPETTETVEFDVTDVTVDSELSEVEDAIVVGGPIVNEAARELLGVEMYSPETDEHVKTSGDAVIRYFEDSNSILVYGYTKEDTIAAVDSLNEEGLTGDVKEVSN